MRTTDRAQRSALALLAAVAATVAAGIAVLARAGAALCGQRVFVHHHAGAMTMGPHGMGAAVAASSDGVCPILLWTAGCALVVCLLAAIVLVTSRAPAPAVAVAAARRVSDTGIAPLSALLGLAGAVPIVAIVVVEGGIAGWPALGACAALVAGAVAGALALAGAARIVLALGKRLAVVLAAAFRLLSPGANAPWAIAAAPLLAPVGVRLAPRGPSRAPPI